MGTKVEKKSFEGKEVASYTSISYGHSHMCETSAA